MRILPFILLFGGLGIFVPTAFYLYFHKRGDLTKVPTGIWAITGFISFIFFPLFLFRKHWESAMVFKHNTFWFVAGVVQMDNNFFETLAKLLAILVLLALMRSKRSAIFQNKSFQAILGYWVGLCYGIGEAITLSLIGYFPMLNRIFGVALFMYFTTWYTVWERAYAIQLHAIIGTLVGLGCYHWFGLNKRWWFLFFFVCGMLYHELVDGLVLVMMYYPLSGLTKFIRSHLYSITLPGLLVIGYLIILIAYRASQNFYQDLVRR